MPGPLFATGDPVSLHTVEEDDLSFVQRGWTDPSLRRPLSIERPMNREALSSFLETVDDSAGVKLLTCVDKEDAADERGSAGDDEQSPDDAVSVGTVSLFDVVPESGVGSIAYWIAPEFQGSGFGRAAVRRLLTYAFDERRLNRVRADVLAGNDASVALLERLGFVHEGVNRGQKQRAGQRVDTNVFGLLAHEWREAEDRPTDGGVN